MSSPRSFPIFVDVATAPPLVVGGTTLAAAKVRTLLLRAHHVTVAAVSLVDELHDLAATGAIEWLCKIFGFEQQLVVPNDDGTIAHAQLSFGNGMIMLASVLEVETEFGRLIKQPILSGQ